MPAHSRSEGKVIVSQILLECGGALVVLYGLSEVFRDIFHPTQSGTLSEFLGRAISKAFRHTWLRPAVGPMALVTVILCWDALLVGGFALIYSGLPANQLSGGIPQSLARRYLESLYMSLGAFDTFKTFDLIARSDWLRLVIAIEGLIGLTMITASVSWIVLLYPAYARSRLFGRRVSSLLEAENRTQTKIVESLGPELLMEMCSGALQFRLDVILFPILLHFYPTDESATVSHVLPELARFASEAQASARGDCQLGGTQLQIALEALSQVLATRVLRMPGGDVMEVFQAFQQTAR